jgi:hypothetical protein
MSPEIRDLIDLAVPARAQLHPRMMGRAASSGKGT